ncbi:putative Peptidyl-prolyl cis-trans isomerase, FKBP-type [Nitrospira sp. KM1]|uniref:FKBP-type peptidyl-prolyl cis-trans isomerase n=1 Tax=Nitrospira sp. KM1 TaxID=1936990 RepID=UPI0013A72B0D|nr:FKBP-type peptidyl-prolyl cis-trans isomerase [Nitrospira sp. KM1]BCA52969.1 putative Peptidyl-prolyl cis-trans isomerase, FKBP-type [Nitrospira sp. KM1]
MPPSIVKLGMMLSLFGTLIIGGIIQPALAQESHPITEGSNVTLIYHITVPGNTAFEVKDVGRFVQGKHQLLPSLERAVTGMKTGEEKQIELTAEDGFGPYDAGKQKTIPKVDLPDGTKEGDILQDKAGQSATVTHLSGGSAVMDYNHPLAGKAIVVKLKILKVEDPS